MDNFTPGPWLAVEGNHFGDVMIDTGRKANNRWVPANDDDLHAMRFTIELIEALRFLALAIVPLKQESFNQSPNLGKALWQADEVIAKALGK